MDFRGLDSERFLKQLEKKHQQSLTTIGEQSPGMFRILDFVFCFYPTSKVDFDSFTVGEMTSLLEEAHSYSCEHGDGYVDRNWYNVVHEYLRCTENVGSLHCTKSKIFFCEDDFI